MWDHDRLVQCELLENHFQPMVYGVYVSGVYHVINKEYMLPASTTQRAIAHEKVHRRCVELSKTRADRMVKARFDEDVARFKRKAPLDTTFEKEKEAQSGWSGHLKVPSGDKRQRRGA